MILHPPYFNSYKYSSVNSLEMGWLGFDRLEYNKKEIREFFKVGKPENVDKYVDLEAEFQKNHEPASDVMFDVLGPEFREDEIVSKWGREVYERACSEVPNMEGQEGEKLPLKDLIACSKSNEKDDN